MAKTLQDYFKESLIIELIWEDNIEFKIITESANKLEKISNINLLKKYISKKIRMIFK